MKSYRYKKASSRIAKRERARRVFALVFKIGAPIALLVGLVMLTRADSLQIKNFEVEGEQAVSEEHLKNAALSFISSTRFWLLPKSNIFLLGKNELSDALRSEFGRIQEADIDKNFLDRSVKISVKERQSDFLWCSGVGECFFMDNSGLVFEKAPIDGGLIVFRGVLEGNPLMKEFATQEKMQKYSEFITAFKEAGFGVGSVDIESAERGVAATQAGDIIFNPNDANLALAAQNAILLVDDTRSKDSSARFDYIDTRFGNKLFYKLK